jgi:hypothetical protein
MADQLVSGAHILDRIPEIADFAFVSLKVSKPSESQHAALGIQEYSLCTPPFRANLW